MNHHSNQQLNQQSNQPLNWQERNSSPLLLTMNFQDGTMMLNEGILDALGRPGQVQILLNREKKRLLIRRCEVNSRQAVLLPADYVMQVEIGGRSLLRNIRKLARWDTEQPRICAGEIIPDYGMVCFDLSEAIAVTLVNSGKQTESVNQTADADQTESTNQAEPEQPV